MLRFHLPVVIPAPEQYIGSPRPETLAPLGINPGFIEGINDAGK